MLATLIFLTIPYLAPDVQEPAQDAQNPVAIVQVTQPEEPAMRGRRGGRQPRQTSVRTYALKHAEAMEAAHIVGSVCRVGAVADPRTNSIIVQATDAELAQVEDVLKNLDVAVPVPQSEDGLTIVQVRHREARDIVIQLLESMTDQPFKAVADVNRGNILLNGDDRIVRRAKDVISELDTPASSVSLEFSFFSASLNDERPAGRIPADLSAVAKSLERFGRVEYLGQFLTSAVEGQKFDLSGTISNLVEGRVQGRVASAPAGGSVRLDFECDLTMLNQKEEDASRDGNNKAQKVRRPAFSLGTTITTERGHFVVVGSAPSGWEAGESAILVLHIREQM